MIVELVTFRLPEGWTRAQELDAARAAVPKWTANPDLVRKHFLWGLGEDAGTGAGLYLWPSIEAARRAHDDEWRAAVKRRTGHEPTIRYFDLMTIVDNERGAVTEWSESGEARRLPGG